MTAHEILVDARRLIAAGWCQGVGTQEIDGRSHHCMIGATGSVARSWSKTIYVIRMIPFKEAIRALYSAIECGDIATWNDMPGLTKEEVLAAFDKAIAATAPEPPLTVPAEWEPVAVA